MRAIPKDLDFIILKALRKEPEERYGSADALVSNIRAFLESRPVRARRGNAWYASRKFLRRHWVPMAAAAAIVCSLAAGLLVANRERATLSGISWKCANWPTSCSISMLWLANCPAALRPGS